MTSKAAILEAKPKPAKKQAEVVSKMTSYVQRALVLKSPSIALLKVCKALGLQAKNLFNTTHFCVNNILTAYEKCEALAPADMSAEADKCISWRRKLILHEHQIVALERFNTVISGINAKRQVKYDWAMADWRALSEDERSKAKEPKLVALPALGDVVESPYRAALDITVLDNVLRTWPGQDGQAVYARLPAKSAQQVILRYKANWSGFFEALKRFNGADSNMLGRPRPPSYLPKKSRYVLEMPLTQMGDCLISLGSKRSIPVDFEETVSLTEEELSAWNDYNIAEAVRVACEGRGYGTSIQAQHLRIVPSQRGVKFEVVVRVLRGLPQGSLLAQLETRLGTELTEAGAKRNEALISAVRAVKAERAEDAQKNSVLRLAGLDMGANNTTTVAFSTGHRSQIVSAGRLEQVLQGIDAQTDRRISALTTPELRALQGKKLELRELNQKLSRSEDTALRKGLKALYVDDTYCKLREQRSRWLADYLHKLSHGLVAACNKNKIDVLVLGQNKGWKDGMDMGGVQNRRFGNALIARLIELITYKAEALGMVVVTTEESYTSKTSFVNNEALKNYKEEKSKEKSKNKEKKQVENDSNASAPGAEMVPAAAKPTKLPSTGYRLQGERHTFVNKNQSGRLSRVHADVNVSFNILRKVFQDFEYHEGLTLKYDLLRLSPRWGLCKIRNLGSVQRKKLQPAQARRHGCLNFKQL